MNNLLDTQVIFVVDVKGRVLNTSQGMPETNINKQSYFINHNENESMFLRH